CLPPLIPNWSRQMVPPLPDPGSAGGFVLLKGSFSFPLSTFSLCSGLGPVLTCPWGLCIDSDGDVLVTDWGKQHHRVLIYPSKGVGWPLVTDNLSSPRGLALLPDGHMVVSDSMNHCIKIYQYK
uniref:NHL repeat containing 4 n=1 Tax=Neolamprologus brichardi TaxID=32507 RepID=A0A3Q4N6Q2_NEOBR